MQPVPSETPSEMISELPTANPVAPTNQPSMLPLESISYSETFDEDTGAWTDPLIVTTQAIGHDPYIKTKISTGVMQVAISDKETYLYRFFKNPIEQNQFIQVSYDLRGVVNSGIALVCKVDPGMNTWFEARVNPNESKFNLYQYDRNLKDVGKNPYILLGSGNVAVKDFPPAKANTFSLSCFQDRLILDINNGKRVETVALDNNLDGQLSGIGIMSYDTLPVAFELESVDLKQVQ
jgi:hypothetical protein